MGAIPINLIDTNHITIDWLCVIITERNDIDGLLALCVQTCYIKYVGEGRNTPLTGTPFLYFMEVQSMTTDRQQLAMNLSYLIKNEDVIPGPLLNEILIEYVELINNNRLDDLLEFTNNEVESDFGRG